MKNLTWIIPGFCLLVATGYWALQAESDPAEDKADAVEIPRVAVGSDEDLKLRERLSPMQYRVTIRDGTEPPFQNAYWNNPEPGLYLCLISGEPLFSSIDKYDSGTGWPSFVRPLNPNLILEAPDHSHGMVRTEVRSVPGKSHLGHVFQDGPAPTGLRYCINSAALRFVPVAEFEEEGLQAYREAFE